VLAGVPVADYLAAYADEMEQLRAFDRALFGGSPEQRPEVYRESSPLTYVDAVAAPVLLLAGENDPRCPIRQIDNYLDALAARGATYEVSRFDAGHGSLVVEETMRHAATEVAFARRACGL
jgi:dipeptidyl aminopeptidase/acylaminoacyl peptidase